MNKTNTLDIQQIATILTLLISVANFFITIYQGRKIEKFKKSLDIKTLRLQKLWEIFNQLSDVKTKSETLQNILLHSDGSNEIADKLGEHLTELNSIYESTFTTFIKYKTWFSSNQKQIVEKRYNDYQKLEDYRTKLLLNYKEKKIDIGKVAEEGKKIMMEKYNITNDGLKEIFETIEESISKLEEELIKT